MGNVYIRSQDREKLYRFSGKYDCIEYCYSNFKNRGQETEKHTVCISDGCMEEMGTYETKERCIEIIDEIQKMCNQYLYADGVRNLNGMTGFPPFAAVVPQIYEMPQK